MAEPFRAHSISVAKCEHGDIYFRLHDKDGEIFGFAQLEPFAAFQLAEDTVELLHDYTSEMTKQVRGHA